MKYTTTVFPRGISSWQELAARGCFVYCYLRADGSPYYVGLATLASRPMGAHTCGVPRSNPERIRVLRSGLTREEAIFWERFYIARFGRIDLGTGILRNLTDGGDGNQNYGPEAKAKISRANFTDHSRATAEWAGLSMEEWESTSAEERNRLRARKRQKDCHRRGKLLPAETIRRRRAEKVAKRLGIPVDVLLELDRPSKDRAQARYRLGHRGDALLADVLPQPPKPLRSIEHARRNGICPAIWVLLRASEKNLVVSRRKQGVLDQALLLASSQQGKSEKTQRHNLRQQQRAAEDLGLSLETYVALTKNQVSAMRQFLKGKPGLSGKDYMVRRGWEVAV